MALVIRNLKSSSTYQILMTYNCIVTEGSFLTIIGGEKNIRSTLIHLLAGFEIPLSGELYFGHINLQKLPPSARPLTILFSESNLFNHLTVFENASLGFKGTLNLNTEEKCQVSEILEYLGLKPWMFKNPSNLTSYIQQQTALARSILTKKPLLLLDDPFSLFDSQERQAFSKLLKKVHQQFKMTSLMTTSDVSDAQLISSHVALISHNKISHLGETQKFFHEETLLNASTHTGYSHIEHAC